MESYTLLGEDEILAEIISPEMMDDYRRLKPIILTVASENKVHPAIIAGIVATESGFEVNAVNPDSGAAGLMQIMPLHFGRLGWSAPTSVDRRRRIGSGGRGWNSPESNLRAGVTIFREQFQARKSIRKALAGYGGFSTWLRTNGAQGPYPDSYVNKVLTRATFLLIRG